VGRRSSSPHAYTQRRGAEDAEGRGEEKREPRRTRGNDRNGPEREGRSGEDDERRRKGEGEGMERTSLSLDGRGAGVRVSFACRLVPLASCAPTSPSPSAPPLLLQEGKNSSLPASPETGCPHPHPTVPTIPRSDLYNVCGRGRVGFDLAIPSSRSRVSLVRLASRSRLLAVTISASAPLRVLCVSALRCRPYSVGCRLEPCSPSSTATPT